MNLICLQEFRRHFILRESQLFWDRVMQQSPLTVIIPIQDQKVVALRDFLEPIGDAIRRNSILRFDASPSTHFARFVILPGQSGGSRRLLFSSNYDGELPAYAAELASALGPGLNDVFGHCQGYVSGTAMNPAQLLSFLKAHSFSPSVFYVACRGASVQDIQDAIRIREAIDVLLDGINGSVFEKILPLLGPGRAATAFVAGAGPGSSFWTRLLERVVGIRHGEQEISRRMKADPKLAEVEDRIAQNQNDGYFAPEGPILAPVSVVGRFRGRPGRGREKPRLAFRPNDHPLCPLGDDRCWANHPV